MGFLTELYGQHYQLNPIFVEPRDVGHHGVARARVYVICIHKKSVEPIYDCQKLFHEISTQMKLFVATKPSDYFVAETNDIRFEAERVARVRKVHLKPKVSSHLVFRMSLFLVMRSLIMVKCSVAH